MQTSRPSPQPSPRGRGRRRRTYRVEVLTNPVQVLEAVTVGSGQDAVVRVTAQ